MFSATSKSTSMAHSRVNSMADEVLTRDTKMPVSLSHTHERAQMLINGL